MVSSKPAIILIPGSFSQSFGYTPIGDGLRSAGYQVSLLDLLTASGPLMDRGNAVPTMEDDAAHIRAEIVKFIEEGKDVVLVTHSYGGIPGTESTKGLGKAEREKGEKGGVTRLVYLTSVVPKAGNSSADEHLSDEPSKTIEVDVCYYRRLCIF